MVPLSIKSGFIYLPAMTVTQFSLLKFSCSFISLLTYSSFFVGNARLSDMWRIALPNSSDPNAIPQWEQVDCLGDSPPTCW